MKGKDEKAVAPAPAKQISPGVPGGSVKPNGQGAGVGTASGTTKSSKPKASQAKNPQACNSRTGPLGQLQFESEFCCIKDFKHVDIHWVRL